MIVQLQTAKLAKQAGFNEPCSYAYDITNDSLDSAIDYKGEKFTEEDMLDAWDNECDTILMPRQWQLQKWLREKYHLHPHICMIDDDNYLWHTSVYSIGEHPGSISPTDYMPYHSTYEIALEFGLEIMLTYLIRENEKSISDNRNSTSV